MSERSLRARLLMVAAVTIAATLALAGFLLIAIFEQHILKGVAEDLGIRATELAKSFAIDGDGKPFLTHEMADPRYSVPYGGAYWQVSEGKEEVLRSRSLWDQVLGTKAASEREQASEAFELAGPDNSELYVRERKVTLHDGDNGERRFSLLVALDHASIATQRQAFARAVAEILTMLALLLVAGAWAQSRIGLSPLRALHAALTAVHEGRVPRLAGVYPSEVAPLAEDLNRLLDRQEESVRRARDRAGSLAHGLKTPLTLLKGEIQKLERAGQRDAAALMREQCDAIQQHVERELARARMHGAVESTAHRTLVRPIVQKLVDLMRRVEPGAGIDWSIEIPAEAEAGIEADDFAEITGNLLDNARKWARSKVEIAIRQDAAGQTFVITDDGPGIPAHQHETVMQRGVHFSREGDGSTGLGLSIVKEALALYGGRLSIVDLNPGCRVSYRIARSGALAIAAE